MNVILSAAKDLSAISFAVSSPTLRFLVASLLGMTLLSVNLNLNPARFAYVILSAAKNLSSDVFTV